ncbi:hypothetical protein BJX65DRAFT_112999 [Aspergillus insuetus]
MLYTRAVLGQVLILVEPVCIIPAIPMTSLRSPSQLSSAFSDMLVLSERLQRNDPETSSLRCGVRVKNRQSEPEQDFVYHSSVSCGRNVCIQMLDRAFAL